MIDFRRTVPAVILLVAAACGGPRSGSPSGGTPPQPAPEPVTSDPRAGVDRAALEMIPPGYGSLRQEDIAVSLQLPSVLVRALPLEEPIIRVLRPDSYRALHELLRSRAPEIDRLVGRYGARRPRVWYVQFYGLTADARFNPRDLAFRLSGRDFHPLDVIPLSAGFGRQQVQANEVQTALLLFDDELDPEQPMIATMGLNASADWTVAMRRIQRERAMVRSRVRQ